MSPTKMSKVVESKKQRKARAQDIFMRGQKQHDECNLKSGFKLLLSAAKLGDPGAQHNLG